MEQELQAYSEWLASFSWHDVKVAAAIIVAALALLTSGGDKGDETGCFVAIIFAFLTYKFFVFFPYFAGIVALFLTVRFIVRFGKPKEKQDD